MEQVQPRLVTVGKHGDPPDAHSASDDVPSGGRSVLSPVEQAIRLLLRNPENGVRSIFRGES